MIFLRKRFAGVVLVLASMVALAPSADASRHTANFASDDDVFHALRDASRRDDRAKALELAARLPQYAIPSYVDYYRLRPNLGRVAQDEIRAYLARYDGAAIADRLRNDWLLELGRQRDWSTFDEQYPYFVLNDDLQVKCFALMSKAVKGQNVAEEARILLTSPKDYGEPCNALIATLSQNGQFSADDVWAQVRLAAEATALPTARRISALTDVSVSAIEQAIERPALTIKKGISGTRESRELFLIALGRAARSSPQQAAQALEAVAARLSKQEQAIGWAQIALQSSYKLAPETKEYWNRSAGAPLSNDAYQWRVRIALREENWNAVRDRIENMPDVLRRDATWVYWLGRAFKAEGRQDEANTLFESIAGQTHFYGQLAQEELGRKIVIPPAARTATAEEIAAVAANPGFQHAIKFFDMNLRFEGVREWNWQLRKLNEREHLAAAEFARQNNLLDRMVNTSDRTRNEVDFMQRFPSPYRDVMTSMTSTLGLDMAWVYGLIRQESRFIRNAQSHVGATGLMQLMPATARFVARKIGMNDFHISRVNDTDINIQLGTNYLNMVLNDLDGSQAMATAAYNAGPGRPRAWRSTLSHPVEGAIFAEAIPFDETRGYVKSVLSNATYYAALFEGKPQSLKERLGMVGPKDYVASALP